jgi:GNAT superfamily N-acetyltransferase
MTESSVYPNKREDQIRLPNHRLLHIRPLRRGEDGLVNELFMRLSPRTRYLRFLSPMPVLPNSVLRQLADVDDRGRLALVVELDTADGGDVVALGNLGGIDDRSAEVALVVRDDWQHQGIGVALAARLLQAAEDRGYDRFVIDMLWDNPAIRKLLNHIGEIVSMTTHLGVSAVTFVRRRPAARVTKNGAI